MSRDELRIVNSRNVAIMGERCCLPVLEGEGHAQSVVSPPPGCFRFSRALPGGWFPHARGSSLDMSRVEEISVARPRGV